MSSRLFSTILEQACQMGVSCLEFSGGGEPLAHALIDEFLALATRPDRTFKVGLLTNGVRLLSQDNVRAAVAKLDYVRLGYTEEVDASNDDGLFYETLAALKAEKQRHQSSVRLGVKFLLTNKNADKLAKQVKRVLEDRLADHIKVKALRSSLGGAEPTAPVVRRFEHLMADLREDFAATDLQVDVKSARVNAATHRCWISPIMTVIDSIGDVYMCCNYYERRDDLRIGSLGPEGTNKYSDFWGGHRHRAIMKNIPIDRVCNSHQGVDCRLVHAQRVSEPIVRSLDARQLERGLASEPLFPGHRSMI
jgi:MoaA/NifB/PqqE/SkfB family radical SAM enzyme